MGKQRVVIRKDVKEQILARLKNEGIPVATLAEEHGISSRTIYGWLAKSVEGNPSWLEVAKLRKQNQFLLELIGRLTLEVESAKKKRASS